jgi:hypothetical protein
MSSQTLTRESATTSSYEEAIADICSLNWTKLSQTDLVSIACVYYYFSVQFRESLEIALKLYPDDDRLQQLNAGECNTDNLSPWPGVAKAGEKMNHDEFMRRTLELEPIPEAHKRLLAKIGLSYLNKIWKMDPKVRAMALASYEDGGLERVFRAVLTAQRWEGPLLQAFRHFLEEHIKFDSDPDQGHGALCRHLVPDNRICPAWTEFRAMLFEAAPTLKQ